MCAHPTFPYHLRAVMEPPATEGDENDPVRQPLSMKPMSFPLSSRLPRRAVDRGFLRDRRDVHTTSSGSREAMAQTWKTSRRSSLLVD